MVLGTLTPIQERSDTGERVLWNGRVSMNATELCAPDGAGTTQGDIELCVAGTVVICVCIFLVCVVWFSSRHDAAAAAQLHTYLIWQLISSIVWISGQLVANDHVLTTWMYSMSDTWDRIACVIHDIMWPYALGESVLACVVFHRLVSLASLWGPSRRQIIWARAGACWPVVSMWAVSLWSLSHTHTSMALCRQPNVFVCHARPWITRLLVAVLASHLLVFACIIRFASVVWTALLTPADVYAGATVMAVVGAVWMVMSWRVGFHAQPTQVTGTSVVLSCVLTVFFSQLARLSVRLMCRRRSGRPNAYIHVEQRLPRVLQTPSTPQQQAGGSSLLENDTLLLFVLADPHEGPAFLRDVARTQPFLAECTWAVMALGQDPTPLFADCARLAKTYLSRDVLFDPYIRLFCRMDTASVIPDQYRIDTRGHRRRPPSSCVRRMLWRMCPPTPRCRWPAPLPLATDEQLAHAIGDTRCAYRNDARAEKALRSISVQFGIIIQQLPAPPHSIRHVSPVQTHQVLRLVFDWCVKQLLRGYWKDYIQRNQADITQRAQSRIAALAATVPAHILDVSL